MATTTVNTSSFTPAQLAAFNSAAKLAAPGNTVVASTGSQNPNATAASSSVTNPAAPSNTAAQSNYISSQASASSPNLTQQLLAGNTSTPAVPTSLYNINSNGNNPTTTTTPTPSTTNNAQSFNQGTNPLGTNVTPTTTMYKSDGTSVQVPTANVSLNTYNATSNPSGYYATNPTATNPNTSTTGSASTTPSAQNTAANGAGILAGLSPSGSTPTYTSAIENYNNLAEEAQQYQNNLLQGENDVTKQAIPLEFQQGQQAALQRDYGVTEQNLTQQAQIALQEAQLLSPANATQQVGQGTTVLNSNNQPVVTTPAVTTPGSAEYTPTPTTYTSTPTGTQVNPTSGVNPTAYTVASGDTLTSIAAQKGTTVAALEAANSQITNPNLITVGQQINLPSSGGTGTTSTLIGSPYAAGTIAGQEAAGQNVQTMKSALAQALPIHAQITSLLQANPTLNSSPASAVNALNQWVNSTQIPSGPYFNLLQDLQEYANTIAPAIGVGGSITDQKTAIANSMIPILAGGGTIEAALNNLETTASGKINAAQAVGQNPNINLPVDSTSAGSTASSTSTGSYAGSAWN